MTKSTSARPRSYRLPFAVRHESEYQRQPFECRYLLLGRMVRCLVRSSRWPSTPGFRPPCRLAFFTLPAEIPGPYPQSPKGWGGANASGYSNPAFDQACQQALSSLPDDAGYKEAQSQAQEIFAEDLPAIPLYLRLDLVATRPDMCGVTLDPSAESALWNLEAFNYGASCPK